MFRIRGGKELSGTVKVGGAKNAVLKIIPAALLLKKVTLKNVPDIEDIYTFIEILEGYGVKCSYDSKNRKMKMDSSGLKELSGVDHKHFSDIRASVILLAPILEKLGHIDIPTPGGDKIGRRGIETHLDGLNKIGYDVQIIERDGKEFIVGKGKSKAGDTIINGSFSVTGTENVIISNVLRSGETVIKNAAIEPHVMNLIDFLREAGADIKIRYDHTIVIQGVLELREEIEFEIISDYLQSGTYMVIAALCAKEYIDIENARLEDLYSFLEKFHEAGVKTQDLGNDTLRVYKSKDLKAVNLQTNIFPGFPTDLQSLFAILMTQAEGESRIHEILYEGRLGWLAELEKMGAELKQINPHESKIFGKTPLIGNTVTSWDLRAGCAVVIAGLIAEGQTDVTNIEYIKRGYEDFVENLQALGADIEEIK